MKLGLEKIRKLLAALGNPEKEYLKVQIAGTNGKGSVCAFLKAICLEAGIRAGVYTSPHLISITERINIGGVDITEDEFAKFASLVRETAERLFDAGEIDGVPTFFEQVTAIALLAFAEAKVEFAILETGLGGRLDATTAANAEIAAITRIDVDHQEYLGNTLAEIAAEKAAIIDGAIDVVLGAQRPDVFTVLPERCLANSVEPITGGGEFDWTLRKGSRSGSVKLETNLISFNEFELGLKGEHQIENAQVAVSLSQVLHYGYVDLADEAVFLGLQGAHHPGRLEFEGRFLFDGAHNVGGAKALRAFLEEFVIGPITLIFGAMNDKAVRGMAEILFSKADRLILTAVDNPRAMSAAEIAEQLPDGFDRSKIILTNSTDEALKKATEVSSDGDVIVVTGSLYLVGEAKRLLTAGNG